MVKNIESSIMKSIKKEQKTKVQWYTFFECIFIMLYEKIPNWLKLLSPQLTHVSTTRVDKPP